MKILITAQAIVDYWGRDAREHRFLKRQSSRMFYRPGKTLGWCIETKTSPLFILFYWIFLELVLELVSKELNHFMVIADLFLQIGGHSSRFVLFCSFWRLFTIKMIKSVKVFPFSFWKIITKIFFFLLHKIQTPGINMQNGRQVI